jgi:histidine triad (HIT) family protein
MDECLFCKIVRGEIPCFKIYEDKNFLSFLTIGPVNKGHTLVVPKKHYQTILDIDKNELGKLMEIVQKITPAVIKGTKAEGFNIHINNKRAAGQLVDHLHIHIIPRYENDGFQHWPQSSYNKGEPEKIAKQIKSFL